MQIEKFQEPWVMMVHSSIFKEPLCQCAAEMEFSYVANSHSKWPNQSDG
jgi:hypothetical protein